MEYASKATADAGLTTGIIGTALGALNSGIFNGGLGNLFGGNASAADLSGMAAGAALAAALGAGGRCSEDKTVNRYELSLQQKLAEKDAQIALRDANTYGDQKMLEVYKYIDGQLKDIRGALCAQSVRQGRPRTERKACSILPRHRRALVKPLVKMHVKIVLTASEKR